MRCFLIANAAAFLVSTLAFADLLPPETEGCQGKTAGDSCTTYKQQDGVCVLVKNGYCRFHPSHGSTCSDTIECRKPSEASPSIDAAYDNARNDHDAEQVGCSAINGTVTFASIGFGALILLALRTARRRT